MVILTIQCTVISILDCLKNHCQIIRSRLNYIFNILALSHSVNMPKLKIISLMFNSLFNINVYNLQYKRVLDSILQLDSVWPITPYTALNITNIRNVDLLPAIPINIF